MRLPAARRFLALALAGTLSLSISAFAARPGPPPITGLDEAENLTPLSRSSGDALDKKLREGGRKTRDGTDCADFAGKGKRPKGKKNNDAIDCGVPGYDVVQDPPFEEKDGNGNTKRKVFKNTVDIQYDTPDQRGMSKWPDLRINPKRTEQPDVENNTREPDPLTDIVGVKVGPHPDRPPSDPSLSCANFHPEGAADSDADGCNLGRLMVKLINKKAASTDAPPGQTKKFKKAFNADDDGNCLNTPLPADTALPCGQERRKQHIAESYEITCDKDGFVLVDGHCRKVDPAAGFAKALGIEPTPGSMPGGSAMMGFTFAPPHVKWGIDYSEEACIDLIFDEFCFTVFSAFVGYDIDIAAGLRLPVDLDVTNAPQPKAIAGRTVSLTPALTPADFSAAEYKAFCQLNNMADGWIISDCDRFSFPEFFSTELNKVFPSQEVDGKEMVAQAIIKAGVFIEVLGVSVVSVGINAGNDFSTMCTMSKLRDHIADFIGDFASFGVEIAKSQDLLQRLKDTGLNCSSFTTPFGAQQSTLNPLVWTKPTFPFLPEAGLHLPADCNNPDVKDVEFTVKGTKRKAKLCTGLALTYGPASLGLGLDVKVAAVSGKIQGQWSLAGDARRCAPPDSCNEAGDADVEWIAPDNADIQQPTLPILFDNFENAPTSGTLRLNDFTFCLNQLQVALFANLEFGGLLSFLPNLASVPIYSVSFGVSGCGIPIPQHNATGPVDIGIPVENFALRMAGAPGPATAAELMDGGTRRIIKPGEFGKFIVTAYNMSTAASDFDNFRRTLPDQVDTTLPAGWTTSPDIADLAAKVLPDVGVSGSATFELSVSPFRHPRTRVGNYTIPVKGDSLQAKTLHMAAVDPLNLHRTDALAELLVYVKGFREPKIAIVPNTSTAKPGAPGQTYAVNVQNYGNENDVIALASLRVDSNTVSCTLRTLGTVDGCPYRAFPTVASNGWTSIGTMTDHLPLAAGASLEPEGTDATSFTLGVPPDWAGMRDTTYLITVTATSTTDPESPAAFKKDTLRHTVIATKQSMTRYIALELAELAGQIQAANTAGISTGGALPIVIHDLQPANQRALDSILAGDLGKASNTLSAMTKSFGGFLHAIQGGGTPQSLVDDWTLRANAIIQDLNVAVASNVPS